MLFNDLNLILPILEALKTEEYNKPTPIQEKAIPSILAGRDVLGSAQTGTGKTAAFAIPILQMLSCDKSEFENNIQIRSLILAPTRELAIQIGESFEIYGQHLNIKTTVVYGGVSPKRQIKVLKRGVDILIATPGRLLDLISQGHIAIRNVEMFVLDEADRMLDMGMVDDVKRIITHLPKKRQNMLFSATMPQGVSKLVNSILNNPVKIEIKTTSSNKKSIKQLLYYVDEPDKTSLLIHLLKSQSFESVLVFVRTKKKADKVSKAINVENIRSKAIHGDKNQSERQKALESFKNKEIRVLVATDVAARGIDIDELSHVINMDIPNIPETYIHRIGRTGRAGMVGTAISFCNNQEKAYLKDIEKLQGKSIEVIKKHPYMLMNMVLEHNRELVNKTNRASTGKSNQKSDSMRNREKTTEKQLPKNGRFKNKYQR